MKLIVTLSLAIIFFGCSDSPLGEKRISVMTLKNIPDQKWERLATKRILFGHQSVGDNLVEGMAEIITENPKIKLRIVEVKTPEDFQEPCFGHFRVGKNEDPGSKFEHFAKTMEKGFGDRVEIAFMKLCFVDVNRESNVKDLFADYRESMKGSKEKYANTVFVHITLPLTSVQKGPKVWIKKLIGRAVGGYEENIKRQEYNELLRAEYTGREPLFDLASFESTLPDGKRERFMKEGKSYPALLSHYTDDGAHLNKAGRKIVAEQLLIFLANIIQ